MGQALKFLKKGYRVKMVVIGKVSAESGALSGGRFHRRPSTCTRAPTEGGLPASTASARLALSNSVMAFDSTSPLTSPVGVLMYSRACWRCR